MDSLLWVLSVLRGLCGCHLPQVSQALRLPFPIVGHCRCVPAIPIPSTHRVWGSGSFWDNWKRSTTEKGGEELTARDGKRSTKALQQRMEGEEPTDLAEDGINPDTQSRHETGGQESYTGERKRRTYKTCRKRQVTGQASVSELGVQQEPCGS